MARRERTPGATVAAGYDARHKKLRAALIAAWRPFGERPGIDVCWRCLLALELPSRYWDLGHDDEDRSKYRGLEHRHCNRGAGARNSNTTREPRPWVANPRVASAGRRW